MSFHSIKSDIPTIDIEFYTYHFTVNDSMYNNHNKIRKNTILTFKYLMCALNFV